MSQGKTFNSFLLLSEIDANLVFSTALPSFCPLTPMLSYNVPTVCHAGLCHEQDMGLALKKVIA